MRQYTEMNFGNDDETCTRVRVCVDGVITAALFSRTGERLRAAERKISRDHARKVVQQAFELSPRLTDRGGDLRITIGGDGERSWTMTLYDLPHAGLVYDDEMRRLASDTLAGPGRSRGPSDRRLTLSRLAGWSVLSAAIAIVSVALARLAGTVVGMLAPIRIYGPLDAALAVEAGMIVLLSLFGFWVAGLEFGESYRGEANVLWPTLLGLAPLAYLGIAHGSVAFAVLLCVLPIVALCGQRQGFSPRPGPAARLTDHSLGFAFFRW